MDYARSLSTIYVTILINDVFKRQQINSFECIPLKRKCCDIIYVYV